MKAEKHRTKSKELGVTSVMVLFWPIIQDTLLGLIFPNTKRENGSQGPFQLSVPAGQPLFTLALPILSTRWHMNAKFLQASFILEGIDLILNVL